MKLWWLTLPLLAGCASDNGEAQEIETDCAIVKMMFSPYQMEAMTRSVTSIASVVTRLDVWIVNGGDTIAAHQTSSDGNFGAVTATLDKRKTYTIYSVGHKAAGEATLSNGVIAWPEEKVTHSMVYASTFTPGSTTAMNCEMKRIVGNFRVEVEDAVPNEVKRMEIHIGVSPTRWDVTNGGCSDQDRTANISIPNLAAGTVNLSTFIIAKDDMATNYTITVTAYDGNDQVVQARTFADVPIRNGYKTTYRGQFFTDAAMSMAFMVDDWQEFNVVQF